MISSSPAGPAEGTGFFINRGFLTLWIANSLSGYGDLVFETTLVIWIATGLAADESWSPVAVAGLLATSAVPTILLGPVAGVFADRWPARRTMIAANWLSAALITALTIMAALAAHSRYALPLAGKIAFIYIIVLLASTVAQFFGPSSARLLRDLVTDPDLPRAASLRQSSSSLALLLGPSLAAPLYVAFGAVWGLSINALSFVISAVALSFIRLTPPASDDAAQATATGVFAELKEGLGYFRSSRRLLTIATCMTTVMVAAGIMNTLDVYFVRHNLGVSNAYFGLLTSAQGVGMLAGALVGTVLTSRLDLPRLLWSSLLIVGVLTLAYARLTAFWPAVAVIFVLGIFVTQLQIALGPMMFQATPRNYIGRVSATFTPLLNAGMIGGLLLGGLLYGTVLRDVHLDLAVIHVGPLDTIFSGAGLICIVAALFARRNFSKEQATMAQALPE